MARLHTRIAERRRDVIEVSTARLASRARQVASRRWVGAETLLLLLAAVGLARLATVAAVGRR